MKAAELIEEIERIGGVLNVRGNRIVYRLPAESGAELIEELRQHKTEIIAVLSQKVCWHCGGSGRCGCIACWQPFAGEIAPCVVCHGIGETRRRVQ